MVLPIAYVAGAAGAALANVGVDYAIHRYQGKSLTRRDVGESIFLGVIPGLRMSKHSMTVGRAGRGLGEDLYRYRGAIRGEMVDIGIAGYMYASRPIVELGKIGVKTKVYRTIFHSSVEKAQSTLERSLTSSSKRVGTFTPGRKKTFRSKSMLKTPRKSTYCLKHKKYDFCKYYKR